MRLISSSKAKSLTTNENYILLINTINPKDLKLGVETLSYPRDYYKEPEQNKKAGLWIFDQFLSYGFNPEFQGIYNNVIAKITIDTNEPYIIVGGHYDSVPKTPGADDNASAVIVMLQAAKALMNSKPKCNILFVAFNVEEHGLLGSKSFVNDYIIKNKLKVKNAHILEMVGYTSKEKQNIPRGLPIKLPDTGDFLGIISNSKSNHKLNSILSLANSYLLPFPVLGLKVYCGLEKVFRHLERSDHASFWDKKLPAMMWTDTSEFRNPHYHKTSDLPSTLDYLFMCQVTKLLTLTVLLESS